MPARTKKTAPAQQHRLDAETVLAAYAGWLQRQPLATRSRAVGA